jgi:hypothetical protein
MDMPEVETMNMVKEYDYPSNHRLGGGGYEYGRYPHGGGGEYEYGRGMPVKSPVGR